MRWSCFALLAVVACTSRPSHVHVGAHQSRGLAKVSSGLVAVEWRPGTTHKQIDAEDLKLGVKAEFEAPDSESDELTVVHTDGLSDESLKQLQADPLVQDVEPVYEYESLFVPNDPDFVRQWHMSQIGVESAWDWGTGSDVVVAVIDTGVATLSDLPSSELVPGYDFVNKRATATDDQGHGSHVAGTIAQATNNGAGVSGVAHHARIMPLKVLDARGRGQTPAIADAIRWAVDHGAKVLNLSLGGGAYSKLMAHAVKYAHDKGAVVVCAAGNDRGPVNYPAAYEGAVGVSAVRFDRTLAPYSSFGPEVDLAAPGGDTSVDQNNDGFPDGILQQTVGGKFALFQGTSMATPHVAGAAALLAGAGVTRGEAIEQILLETATPLGDRNKYGAGEVDAGAALRRVRLHGGLWRLGLALALAFLARMIVVRNREQVVPLGLSGWLMLTLASAGILVIPLIGYGHGSVGALLSTPLPEWGQMLNGASTSSPLWLSALGPFLAMGLARWRLLRGVGAALALGFAAYLLHAAWVGWVDIAWLPGRPIEAVWLTANGLLAFGFGTMALRQRR